MEILQLLHLHKAALRHEMVHRQPAQDSTCKCRAMYDLGEPDAKTELQGLSAIDSFNKIDLEHSAQFEVFFLAPLPF
jgi:hypothetical protein